MFISLYIFNKFYYFLLIYRLQLFYLILYYFRLFSNIFKLFHNIEQSHATNTPVPYRFMMLQSSRVPLTWSVWGYTTTGCYLHSLRAVCLHRFHSQYTVVLKGREVDVDGWWWMWMVDVVAECRKGMQRVRYLKYLKVWLQMTFEKLWTILKKYWWF